MNLKTPDNVILIITDSLRYDIVNSDSTTTPYIRSVSKQFTNARACGCWTLPATASMFTGLLPHEHGGTSQTRYIDKKNDTLAEILRDNGFDTYQITANVATTEIFGLERGFNVMYKLWDNIVPKFPKLIDFLILIGKPRIRKKLFSKNILMNDLSEDIKVGNSWLQSLYPEAFLKANEIIETNEKIGKKAFIFLNLMETHYPYHIDKSFKFLSQGIYNNYQEIKSLFRMVDQSFLKNEDKTISVENLQMLKKRQKESWKLIEKDLDAFVKEQHEGKNNLIIFGSDHGENFGDEDWIYHFSNLTEAGIKIPLFWLDNIDKSAEIISQEISQKFIFNSILKSCKIKTDKPISTTLFTQNFDSIPISESFWYNNNGRTLEKYKFNQFSFFYNDVKYIMQGKKWFALEIDENCDGKNELKGLDTNINPIHEINLSKEQRNNIQVKINEFNIFSEKTIKP
jgi:Sulfatase